MICEKQEFGSDNIGLFRAKNAVLAGKKARGSADVYELEALGELALQGRFEDLVIRVGEPGVVGDNLEGILTGQAEQVHILDDVGDAELGQTVLAGAEELTRPANSQVLLGNAEAVGSGREYIEAALGVVCSGLGKGQAVSLVRAAGDASAQLVELGKAGN